MGSEIWANDSIIVIKDARLEVLSVKQAYINKRTSMMTSSGLYKGFRIQLISTASRDAAQQMKTDMMNKYPDQKIYMLFQSPNFKVRMGNFLKRKDAERFRMQLIRYFPQGVYIVEDAIEYTPKDDDIF
jgi:hypothetical protein